MPKAARDVELHQIPAVSKANSENPANFGMLSFTVCLLPNCERMASIRIFCHMTSEKAAGMLIPLGDSSLTKWGLFGGGISFAETESAADYEVAKKKVLIIVEVDLGWALVLEGAFHGMNGAQLQSMHCNSIKGLPHSGVNWEYVT
jgi:hypothetical protein